MFNILMECMSTLTGHFSNGQLVYLIKTHTKKGVHWGGSKGACLPWKLIKYAKKLE